MNNVIPVRKTSRAPRARHLLAALPLLLCGLPSAIPAQDPILVTGTRTGGLAISTQLGTSYEIVEGAVVTWNNASDSQYAIYDTYADTVSWTIVNRGTVGMFPNGAAPYNGIYLKTTASSTIINEATGYITTGAVTGENRAGVNFELGWGHLVNKGSIIGASNGVYLGVGGIVENTGTIIGLNASRSGIWFVKGDGAVYNTGGYIEGGYYGIRVSSGTGVQVWNTAGGVISGTGSTGDGIIAGANTILSVTNDASTINAVRRGVHLTTGAGPGVLVNINGAVISSSMIGVYSVNAMTITNGAGSLIEGLGTTTSDAGILMTNAALLTLTNAGTISGGGKGIQVGTLSGHILVNESGGVIRNTTVPSSGTPGAVVQSGASAVARMTLTNAGLIEGQQHGVYALNEAIIHNTGTIRALGAAAAAISFSATNASNSLLTLDTGSVLEGDVISSSTNWNQIILRGSGAEDSNFIGRSTTTGFRSLTMEGADWTLSGTVSLTGSNAALHVATGTLSIAGNVLFRKAAGNVEVDAGATLRLTDGAVLSSATAGRNASIATAGEVLFDHAADLEHNGGISGAGSVRKTGLGTLTLSGSNTYRDTVIETGTLKGAIGRGVLTVQTAGVYDAGAAGEVVISGLAGDGTVMLGAAANLVFDAGSGTSVFSFSGILNGGNRFIKTGSGTLDLQQTLSVANGTHIKEGVLRLDDAAKLGAGTLTLGGMSTHGMIDYTGAGDWSKALVLADAGGGFLVNQATVNFTGAATGAGAFAKAGAGVLDITAANMTAHTGGVAVLEGTLRTNAGAINGNSAIAAGAVLEFNQTAGGAYAGAISGSGALHKTGVGDLSLSGANTYGDTLISAGLLEGNVGLGTLTIDASGTYRMAPGQTAPLGSIQGNGAIDLNGNALLINIAGGVTGTFAFSGAMTGGDTFEKTGGGVLALTGTIGLDHANIKEGVLRLSDQSQLDTGANDPVTLGGASTRGFIEYTNAGAVDWTKNISLAGAGGGFIINQTLVKFTGTATGDGSLVKSGGGTLDITGAGMAAHTGGVAVDAGTIKGDTSTIKGDAVIGAGAVLEFYQTAAGAYTGVISGSGALHKTGGGALDLGTAAHSYGDTLVSAGLLEGNIGLGTLTVDTTGTYRMAAGSGVTFTGIQGGGTVDLNGNDLRFDIAAGVTGTFANGINITNAGMFIKTGAGVLDLQKTLSTTDGVFVKDGALRIDAAARLGAGAVTLGDASTLGMIDYTGVADFGKSINLAGAGGGFIVNQAGNVVVKFTGSAAGGGDFAKSGSGTLDITNADMTAHTGGVRVDAGTLRGNTSTIKGGAVVGAGSVLEFNQTANGVYSGTISGSGALLKTGAGLLDLGLAAHTYGDTSIEGGVVVGSIGSGVLNIGSAGTYRVRDGQTAYTSSGIMGTGTLDLNQADLVFDITSGTSGFSFSGVYAGAGGNKFIKKGAGLLDLQSNATLPGGSAIEEGVVRLPDQAFLGAAIVLGSGTTAGFLEYTGSAAWTKAVEIGGGGGGFAVSGSNEAHFAGTVSGGGAFIKEGAGRLDSTGANFGNAGGIVVRSGTLAGIAQGFGSAASVTVDTGAALEFAQETDASYNGTVTGAGSVHKTGAGVLTLMRALENTGGIAARAGVLRAGAQDVWINASAVSVSQDGALDMGGFSQRIGSLANDGAIIFNAKVNSVAGVIYEMDRLQVTGNASGAGTIRVNINEAVLDGAASELEIAFFEITGSNAAAYTAEINGRHVSGAYDWVVTPSEDRKIYTLSADQLSPEVPALGGIDGAGYLAGKASLASLSQRLMLGRTENSQHGFQLWANGLWREDRLNDALYDHAKARTKGFQVGGDWNNKNANEKLVTIGVFYDSAETDMDLNGKTSSTKAKSSGVGLYASYRPSSLYIDMVVRSSQEDYDIIVPGAPVFSTEGTSIAASIEVGGVLPVDWSWNIEPQAQATLQKHKVDNAVDSFGREYAINSADTVEGRFGLRFWREISLFNGRGRLTPYMQPSLVYEWGGERAVVVNGKSFANHMGGSYGAIDAGASLLLGRHCLINANAGWYAGSKMNGYAFNAGLSLLW